MTTAVITGASSGLGAALALRLASDGVDLVLAGRDADRLQQTFDAVVAEGVRAETVVVDVREGGSAEKIVQVTRERFGEIDILVNNAGNFHYAAIEETTDAIIDDTLDVHVKFPVRLTALAVPLIRRGGSILFVGSNLAHYGSPGVGIYSAAKAAVEALTRTLAVELGPRGIRVNAVSPGVTRTPMTAGITADTVAESTAIEASPVGRLGTPEELADAMAYLCGPSAGYVNGVSLVIDGGRHLR